MKKTPAADELTPIVQAVVREILRSPDFQKLLKKAVQQAATGQSYKDGLATLPEAAEMLGVSRWTIYKMINAGEIEHVLVNSASRIPWSALEKYVSKKTTKQPKTNRNRKP